MNFKNYIGVDISKNWLDIAIIRSESVNDFLTYKIDNNFLALRKFKKEIRQAGIKLNKESLVVMEHTGIYQRFLVDFLITQKCPVCIESALRIRKSLGIQRGKTDKADARRIATYGLLHETKISIWHNPRTSVLMLKDLLINRDRFAKAKKVLKTPLKELKIYYPQKQFKVFSQINGDAIQALVEAIEITDAQIKNIIANDQEINNKMTWATSVPGVGWIIALYLLCFTNEFTMYKKGTQLACYAGIAPFPYRSGTTVKGRDKVSPLGNKKLKSLLHIAAVANLRSKNELKDYYDRKVAEGKSKMSVLNALRNKIVSRVTAVIARRSPYISVRKGVA